MYNLISIVFLIIGIFTIGRIEFNMTILIFAVSVGFGIAGSISHIGDSINKLLNCKIKWSKKDFISGNCEIKIEKIKENAFVEEK